MKKFLILTACSFVALIPRLVSAQSNAQYASVSYKAVPSDKFNVLNEKTTDLGTAIPGATVAPKVTRSFSESFKNVVPEWFAMGKTYLARFTLSNLPARALFSKNGAMLYCITYGSEQSLPRNVRSMIRSTYYDYTINGVTRVDSQVGDEQHTAWIANLQSGDQLMVVKVIGRDMEVIGNYR